MFRDPPRLAAIHRLRRWRRSAPADERSHAKAQRREEIWKKYLLCAFAPLRENQAFKCTSRRSTPRIHTGGLFLLGLLRFHRRLVLAVGIVLAGRGWEVLA